MAAAGRVRPRRSAVRPAGERVDVLELARLSAPSRRRIGRTHPDAHQGAGGQAIVEEERIDAVLFAQHQPVALRSATLVSAVSDAPSTVWGGRGRGAFGSVTARV